MPTHSKIRAVALLIYFAALLAIQHWFVHTGLSPDEHAIWLYGGIASLLFGSRLLNPYFTAPADAATNGFVALIALLPAFPLIVAWTFDAFVLGAAVAFCGGVSLASIVVIIFRRPPGSEQLLIVRAIDRAVKGLGSPEIVFTVLIIAAVWLFHREKPIEVFAILTTLAAIVIIRPLEATGAFIGWLWNLPKTPLPAEVVGVIAAHQSPGIVLIRQERSDQVQLGTPLVVADVQSPPLLGVALNYVGRDEGNLLRALTAPLPEGLARRAVLPSATERGIAVSIALEEGEENDIQALVWISRLCGIVDADTTLEYMQFEVINEVGLEEGSLVEVRIGEERRVIYQVIEGLTREEVVQQKNKYGYARGKARKIGAWDEEHGKFLPVSWLPRMNAPIFLMKLEQHQPHAKCIGHFPSTPFGIGLDISSCVTHNTAVLGILGVGKSYLSIELVERMIAQGIKVICLDLTNQYEDALADFLDAAYQEAKKAELIKAGAGGKAVRNRELGGSRNAFKKAVYAQIKEFMTEGDDHFLRVVNPAQFTVTKQISFLDKNDEAELAWLTACEITSIFSDCALRVCQELGMVDQARLCLVYEEAHSLVPEWNSVASDGDRSATATSARAILQGRKYGLGCLLITQRTANVTKTILNQCNTIFAMRTFDDTGKEFLGNYIGSDYARVLPSLQPRHAVVFGKGSSCENPVLVRLNDRNDFVTAFRQDNPPKTPAAQAQHGDVDGTKEDGNAAATAEPEAAEENGVEG